MVKSFVRVVQEKEPLNFLARIMVGGHTKDVKHVVKKGKLQDQRQDRIEKKNDRQRKMKYYVESRSNNSNI